MSGQFNSLKHHAHAEKEKSLLSKIKKYIPVRIIIPGICFSKTGVRYRQKTLSHQVYKNDKMEIFL
jgi:hypothetical protein